MADLSIRNLTGHPLTLISVERFESKREQTGDMLTNVTGTISSFINATDFQSHKTVATGKAHKRHDVDFRVGPFHLDKTDVRTADPDREVIRLTFKTRDHKYEVDVPSEDSRSTTMKKLDGGPHELTAVYVATGACLAVMSSSKLPSWMGQLEDDTALQVLSLPGTHNSPTCYTALPSVRCQAVGVPDQLRNGVRFLDIRVSAEPNDDALALVHSAFPISLTGTKYFADMCKDIYEFLDKNPSETVIMSVKREGTGKANDEQMGRALRNAHIEKRREKWWTEPRVPNLGQARGKIVLMRRFAIGDDLRKCWDGRGYGVDAQAWPDNCEDGKIGNGHIRVQDFYEVTESQNVEKKIEYSRGQLERAAAQHAGDSPAFFVNFLSASNFFNATCWPERIAAKVNPAIVEYLSLKHGLEGKGPKKMKVGTGGTGIVVTDWVGAHDNWDLIRCIVAMNARLQK